MSTQLIWPAHVILERTAKYLPGVRDRTGCNTAKGTNTTKGNCWTGPCSGRRSHRPRYAEDTPRVLTHDAFRHSPTYRPNFSSNPQRCADLMPTTRASSSHPNQNQKSPTRSRCVLFPSFSQSLDTFPYHAFREIACRSASSPAPLSSSTFFPFFIMTKVGMDWTAYFCAVSLEKEQERKKKRKFDIYDEYEETRVGLKVKSFP